MVSTELVIRVGLLLDPGILLIMDVYLVRGRTVNESKKLHLRSQ